MIRYVEGFKVEKRRTSNFQNDRTEIAGESAEIYEHEVLKSPKKVRDRKVDLNGWIEDGQVAAEPIGEGEEVFAD
jgi:hypothetical protein